MNLPAFLIDSKRLDLVFSACATGGGALPAGAPPTFTAVGGGGGGGGGAAASGGGGGGGGGGAPGAAPGGMIAGTPLDPSGAGNAGRLLGCEDITLGSSGM